MLEGTLKLFMFHPQRSGTPPARMEGEAQIPGIPIPEDGTKGPKQEKGKSRDVEQEDVQLGRG